MLKIMMFVRHIFSKTILFLPILFLTISCNHQTSVAEKPTIKPSETLIQTVTATTAQQKTATPLRNDIIESPTLTLEPLVEGQSKLSPLEEQFHQLCVEQADNEATNEKPVGQLWFDFMASILRFTFGRYEYIADKPEQADILVCEDAFFDEGETCYYGDGLEKNLRRFNYVISLIDISSGQVLQKEVFEGEFPEKCPEDYQSKKFLGESEYPAEQMIEWLRTQWVAAEIPDETPTPREISSITEEQIANMFDPLCERAFASEEFTGQAYEAIWPHFYDGHQLFEDTHLMSTYGITEESVATDPLAAKSLLCYKNIDRIIKSCSYMMWDATYHRWQLNYQFAIVNLETEEIVAEQKFYGEEPPKTCPGTITYNSFGVLDSKSASELSSGKPPKYSQILNWIGENLMETSELSSQKYKFIQQGYIEGLTVNDLILDSEGTIWVATDNGLYHFDPDDESLPWDYFSTQTGAWFGHDNVNSIVETDQGIWFAASGRYLVSYDGISFEQYRDKNLCGIVSLAVDHEGNLWSNCGVWNGKDLVQPEQMNAFEFSPIRDEDTDVRQINTIIPDGAAMWLGTRYQLYRYQDGNITTWADPDGTYTYDVWVLYNDEILAGGSFNRLLKINQGGDTVEVPEVYGDIKDIVTSGENIWLVTEQHGIYIFDGKNWDHINRLDGLPMDGGMKIIVGSQGEVWIGGDGLLKVELNE